MSDLLPPEEIRDIVRPALIRHATTWEAIRRHDRAQSLIAARRDVYTRLRLAGYSFPRIGQLVDRHHSSVMHLVGAGVKPRDKYEAPVAVEPETWVEVTTRSGDMEWKTVLRGDVQLLEITRAGALKGIQILAEEISKAP